LPKIQVIHSNRYKSGRSVRYNQIVYICPGDRRCNCKKVNNDSLDATMTYQILEHTADVRIFVQGDSLENLFSDAVYGMMEILKPQLDNQKQVIRRDIAVEAVDTTSLLIDFLNEVLLSVHIHKEMYNEVIFKTLSPCSLAGMLCGFTASSFDEDIKAVTYHEAEVKEAEDGKWETMIVFDI
jgi:SHS2 domain-containing protein